MSVIHFPIRFLPVNFTFRFAALCGVPQVAFLFAVVRRLKEKLGEVMKLNYHLKTVLIFYYELNCLFTNFLHVYFLFSDD